MGHLRDELRRLRNLVFRTIYRHGVYRPSVQQEIVDQFHKLYYDSEVFGGTWRSTYWLGTRVAKCPTDLWLYQELLFKHQPDLVIECGTADGGSALFLASICDLLDKGSVVSVDIEALEGRPTHDRLTYLTGSSTSTEIFDQVKARAAQAERTLVILDSDHRKDHVLDELRLYSRLVHPGGYVVVEDTNLNGNPIEPDFGPGPMEAVEQFLREADGSFVVDRRLEKFYLTFNPSGYLRRVS